MALLGSGVIDRWGAYVDFWEFLNEQHADARWYEIVIPYLESLDPNDATPFTTGLFLVSLISGIALFFHWESRVFHGMHEWLSMVLIAPFIINQYALQYPYKKNGILPF